MYSLKHGRGDEVVGGLHQVLGLGPKCSKIGILEGDVQAALCNEYDSERMGWAWMTNGVVLELYAWGRRNDLSTEVDDIGSVSTQRLSNKIQKVNERKSGRK